MKILIKFSLFSFLLVVGFLAVIYLINQQTPIYQLNPNTAQFIPQQQVPEGLNSLKAQECGLCHIEIYQEWQQTLHAKAYHDPYFQAYLKKDKQDPTCLVCHTPLANQAQELLVTEDNFKTLTRVKNPEFDPELQSEGVTCAACHVRDGIIYGPYPKQDLDAPHPVAFDEKFLQKTICLECHEVPANDFSLLKEGICSTGSESQSGPWAEAGYICQDCHMEAVTRPLMNGFPARKGRRHLWPGGYSNQQLQKVFHFKATKEHNKLHLKVKNAGAGHKVPTGDSDRFIRLKFYWHDDSLPPQLLDEVEFKRRMIWQPIIMEWQDNRLAPGESLHLTWPLPTTKGHLVVQGTYHVMSQWSKNRLQTKYGLSQTLDKQWQTDRTFIEQKIIPIVNAP